MVKFLVPPSKESRTKQKAILEAGLKDFRGSGGSTNTAREQKLLREAEQKLSRLKSREQQEQRLEATRDRLKSQREAIAEEKKFREDVALRIQREKTDPAFVPTTLERARKQREISRAGQRNFELGEAERAKQAKKDKIKEKLLRLTEESEFKRTGIKSEAQKDRELAVRIEKRDSGGLEMFRQKLPSASEKDKQSVFSPQGIQKVFDVAGTKFVRAGVTVSDATGISKVLLPVEKSVERRFFGGQDLKIKESTAAGIFSDIGLFTFFSPAFATTAQIETSIGKTTDVVFGGTAQRTGQNLIKTDIAFTTSQGAKGIARGITATGTTASGDIAGITIGKGISNINRVIKFPTAKIGTRASGSFEGVESTLSKTVGDKSFVQIGKGLIKTQKGGVTGFESAGIGSSITDNTISFLGGIRSQTGSARLFGIIKDIPAKSGINVIKIGSGSGTQTIASQQAVSSLKGIVTAGVQKAPTSITSKIGLTSPIVSAGKGLTTSVKSIQTPTQSITQKQTPVSITTTKSIQTQSPKLILGSGQGQSSKQLQKLKLESGQATRQIQKLSLQSGLAQKTAQIQKLKLSQALKLQTPKAFGFINTIPTSTKTPKFPRLSLRRKPSARSSSNLLTVSVRRFGQFRPVGQARTGRGAVSIGQNIVGKSLAATFKVTGGKSISSGIRTPRGFRTKKEKGSTLFIEAPKLRISTSGEVGEIQSARRRKRKK